MIAGYSTQLEIKNRARVFGKKFRNGKKQSKRLLPGITIF